VAGDAAPALRERLRADIKAAMQARDAAATRLLRALLAAIDNAQAVPLIPGGGEAGTAGAVGEAIRCDEAPAAQAQRVAPGAGEVPRLALTEAALQAVLAAEIAEREGAADAIARHGRPDEAARLWAEAQTVRRYLTP